MRVLMLIFGTVLLLLYILQAIKGKRYDSYTEGLDDKDFPLASLYGVGFAWMELSLFDKWFAMLKPNLVSQAKLLYDPQYAEYYAGVKIAQAFTFLHMGLCAGCVLAGALDAMFFLLIGVGFGVFACVFFLSEMKTKIENRKQACIQELPEIVSSLALLINSGMILRDAWARIAYSKEGEAYTLMQNVVLDMQNGMTEVDAIHKFGVLTDSLPIKKFTSSLIQGIEKGSRELTMFLTAQSTEIWTLKKQTLLQKGEAAATKLLLPIVFIFLGVIVLVIGGAVGMFLA